MSRIDDGLYILLARHRELQILRIGQKRDRPVAMLDVHERELAMIDNAESVPANFKFNLLHTSI